MDLPSDYRKAIKDGAISKQEAELLWKDVLKNPLKEVPPRLKSAHQSRLLNNLLLIPRNSGTRKTEPAEQTDGLKARMLLKPPETDSRKH